MTNKPFIIGVAGGSGSGKSTVTEQIISAIGAENVSVFFQDNYYIDLSPVPFEDRVKINFDHPDALDWTLLKKHLSKLASGLPVDMPEYDFAKHTRKEHTRLVMPAKVIVVEGILAFYDEEMTKQMSLRIFVDTAADIRLIRRIKRDIIERGRTLDSVLDQYMHYVRPMYKKFVEPTKRNAHIIIPHGSNKAALEMVIARINSVLNGQHTIIDDDLFDSELV